VTVLTLPFIRPWATGLRDGGVIVPIFVGKAMRNLIFLPFTLAALPVHAQENVASVDPAEKAAKELDPRQIVVVASRIKGQVDAPQPPVTVLTEEDIAALGSGSITELLGRVASQTGSGRGRGGQPVILVNGMRIANMREMRNFPPEAIKKMEILSEEVALRFGYPADARVINFILKDNFRSRSVMLGKGMATRGGFGTWQGEATLLRISGPKRFSVTATADDTSPLFEAERGLVQASAPLPGHPDPADYRTLVGDSRNFGFNATLTRGLGEKGQAGNFTLNANLTRADSKDWSGLSALETALVRKSKVTNLAGGLGLNTRLGTWQLSGTVDVTHGETETLIDRYAGTGSDLVKSLSNRVESLITLNGRAFRLPAGDVSATVKAGYTWVGFESRDPRSLVGQVNLRRGRILSGINLAVPLTSRRENALGAVGDVSLNLGADWSELSDFGSLIGWNAGVTWSPTEKLGLGASYIVNETAPAISQLGNPVTQSFNVPVYDFARSETARVTLISGGNPDLRRERQRDIKLSANWTFPFLSNSNLLVEYFRNRSNDVTASFPLLTPAIEAAFPGRVTRDGGGRLTLIDQRPITLKEQNSSRLRWGVNLSGPLGKQGDGGGMMGGMGPGGGARPAGGPRPGASRGGGGMMGMMMGGGGGGRWNISAYHTVQFSSRVLVAPGGPLLDLLDGDALSGGGTPRHGVELSANAFYKGMGLHLNGNWNAATRIAASGAPGSSDLHFDPLARIGLVVFADFQRIPGLTKKAKFLKGARMALNVENLFDAHQHVTDGSGTVPLSYQGDYLDPRGRVITFSFRKMF